MGRCLKRLAEWLKENADRIRECRRLSQNKAYAANPDKFKQRSNLWRKNNNQRARDRDAVYRLQYSDKRKAQFAAWRKKHRDYFKARNDSDIENLAEWYVRAKLSRNTHVKPGEWPESLVSTMRAKLKLTRLCRKSRTTTN